KMKFPPAMGIEHLLGLRNQRFIRNWETPLDRHAGVHNDRSQRSRSSLCICSLVGKGPGPAGFEERRRSNCLKIFWRFFNSSAVGIFSSSKVRISVESDLGCCLSRSLKAWSR